MWVLCFGLNSTKEGRGKGFIVEESEEGGQVYCWYVGMVEVEIIVEEEIRESLGLLLPFGFCGESGWVSDADPTCSGGLGFD